MWPIERLRQAGRHAAPPEPREPAAAGQQHPRSVPRGGGWRPGARWAREDQLGHVALPPDEGGRSREELAPLVTSIRDGNRIVIAAADMAARALGLAPGMALAQARAQVAGLDIRDADPEGDRAHLASLAIALARRWTPTVAIAGDDTLFLDLSGVAHLHGGEARMAVRLRRMLARLGYSARIAIADTPGAAWALAHFQGPTLCPPGQHAEALAPLPIEALRIDPSSVELLHRLGVTRIAQLAVMPRAPLVKRFGTNLALQLDRALGRLSEPLHPVVPPEPIAIAQRFAEPIATAEAIEHWLGTLVPRLTAALAEKGVGATRIELIADRIDGVPQRIRIGLARPSRDGAHLLRLLIRRIEQVEPGYGVDALTLHVRRALPLGAESFTERLDEEAAPDLAPLVDTLATRIGMRAMWRSRPVESDVPERSVTRMAVLDPPSRPLLRGKRDDVRQLDRNPPLPPWHPGWPRPARLLARPERLDHVMAELPDHAPRRFTWRGQSHRVIRADGPERIQGEWWKRDAERASIRDYFRVEDEVGRRYWLFRSGDGERAVTGDLSWYLHGVFG